MRRLPPLPAHRLAAAARRTPFHPDFQVLERDLKASTSVDATREMLRIAQVSPFEARGQVFVVASAESLTGEAANALLKTLEEPHVSAPRNFFLLAPSRLDLLRTLRSRSLAVFLGPAEPVDPAVIEPLARAFSAAVAGLERQRLADLPALGGGRPSPASGAGRTRARARPWAMSAAAVLRSLALEDGGAPAPAGAPGWPWPKRSSRRPPCACAGSPPSASSRGWWLAIWRFEHLFQ